MKSFIAIAVLFCAFAIVSAESGNTDALGVVSSVMKLVVGILKAIQPLLKSVAGKGIPGADGILDKLNGLLTSLPDLELPGVLTGMTTLVSGVLGTKCGNPGETVAKILASITDEL